MSTDCDVFPNMVGLLLRATSGVVVLGLCGYTVVAVPIGRRTLFEHGLEIARTQPAQELKHDLGQAMVDAVGKVKKAIAGK